MLTAPLARAKGLKVPVVPSKVISDRNGPEGLLVERFDRVKGAGETWLWLTLEDGTQVLGLPPASKYGVSSEEVVLAMVPIGDVPCTCRFPWAGAESHLSG
ncbi:MAG: hypothetical protein ABI563_12025 [Specibacter sp.]